LITGIAWDHRRCWGPLDASVAPYRAASGQDVRWDRRSLYSFGEGDLGSFAARYDLVIYDHPFVGDIAKEGWLLDLKPFLTNADRALFAADAVGASWRSYAHGGGIWALPIDTAAQTSARRDELMQAHDWEMPKTLAEVISLAERAASHGFYVGWPSVPTDLMCTLVSVAASMGRNPGHTPGDFLTLADARDVVEQLTALGRVVHPESRRWNPIRCLDHMAANDDVVYAPYLFNYVNYARPASGKPITFGPVPQVVAGLPARSILGGAGIGVSSKAADPEAAFRYAMYLSTSSYQAGDYVTEGGQPGSRAAWLSADCNAETNNFFRDCLPTLDAAYLRPTHPGFVPFFHDATLRLAEVVYEGAPLRPFVDWLNGEYEAIRHADLAQVE
jgi:multiple sugar transport system substrate-binding protein